ncbi:techylectin-5A-like [Uloborus diversus]|uniref:techylectin-5A-like n=1 Tax=Uloborus diversus TaxID=327109 RepID=UPI002409F6D8|nr:techylectin-5A-like [Uloborus diversus]
MVIGKRIDAAMLFWRTIVFTLVCIVVHLSSGVLGQNGETATQCNSAKAEAYIATTAALIERLRDTLPSGGGENCKCPPEPMDCDEILRCGFNQSGVYPIWPRNRIMRGSIDVYCDMETSGGGWTVLQRRGDFRRPANFFYRSWHQYKIGFGDLRKDFWLGNDNIYAITNQKKYNLRIDMQDSENQTRYAFYDQFWIDDESYRYKLHVYDYSGDAGDSLARTHDGFHFSTKDRDHDNSTENCAERHKGAWWYSSCHTSNLNGIYHPPRQKRSSDGIIWTTWKGASESLKAVEMKVRPVTFKRSGLDLGVEPA